MQRRNTIQKELVLKAVQDLRSHVTAEEVYEFIRKNHPGIGKGTVYRNLGHSGRGRSRPKGGGAKRGGQVRFHLKKALSCSVCEMWEYI